MNQDVLQCTSDVILLSGYFPWGCAFFVVKWDPQKFVTRTHTHGVLQMVVSVKHLHILSIWNSDIPLQLSIHFQVNGGSDLACGEVLFVDSTFTTSCHCGLMQIGDATKTDMPAAAGA